MMLFTKNCLNTQSLEPLGACASLTFGAIINISFNRDVFTSPKMLFFMRLNSLIPLFFRHLQAPSLLHQSPMHIFHCPHRNPHLNHNQNHLHCPLLTLLTHLQVSPLLNLSPLLNPTHLHLRQPLQYLLPTITLWSHSLRLATWNHTYFSPILSLSVLNKLYLNRSGMHQWNKNIKLWWTTTLRFSNHCHHIAKQLATSRFLH